MKSSKVRKMDRKKKAKEVSTRKSDIHRKRRLDNKAKRAEIHAIDPDVKVTVVNQVAYNEFGNKIEVVNNKIVSTADVLLEVFEAADEGEVNVIEKIETRNKSAIQRLTDKLKGIK